MLANGVDRTLAIPPKHVRRPLIAEEDAKSLQDLAIFDFEDRVGTHRIQALDLYPVLWSDSTGVIEEYSFLIGYPTASVVVNLDDEGQLVGVVNGWIRQDLSPANPMPLDVENRDIFIKDERSARSSVEPDGLSGSPVFSIVRNAEQDRFLRFDGLVTNARGDRFAVYPSVHIRDFMDLVVRDVGSVP